MISEDCQQGCGTYSWLSYFSDAHRPSVALSRREHRTLQLVHEPSLGLASLLFIRTYCLSVGILHTSVRHLCVSSGVLCWRLSSEPLDSYCTTGASNLSLPPSSQAPRTICTYSPSGVWYCARSDCQYAPRRSCARKGPQPTHDLG